MKTFWVAANQNIPWETRKKFVTTAIESGAEAVLINSNEVEKVRELGKIFVTAPPSEKNVADIVVTTEIDTRLIQDLKEKGFQAAISVIIDEKTKEQPAIAAAKTGANYVIISARDWKIIPLENLVAELQKTNTKIVAEAKTAEEGRTLFGTLEKGVDVILIDPSRSSLDEIKKLHYVVEGLKSEKITLAPAKITKIKPVGMGDRVCIDTCSLLRVGEGVLVGSKSTGLFLIHSETVETPYVETRPFRVNAGPVHAYVKVIGGKTKYLSELKAGDEILIVDKSGETRTAIVGRVKIERRPLMLIEAEHKGNKIKTLVQNAETIRLVNKEGQPISVVNLKPGDEILAAIEEEARHFGIKIHETIIER
ncbi:MAG: 3-dehydroquinate synthase II [Euryarchaeota archaeon]|nr:3-dehydroquinate synthase II [Euryarchaeota archaeon]